MLRLHRPRSPTIAPIWVNRGEREGTWGRIGVIVRERGAIVEIVDIVTKFKSDLNLATITPIGD